jgi:hypothetical protein
MYLTSSRNPLKHLLIVSYLSKRVFKTINTGLFTAEFQRKFNVMQHKIPKAEIAVYHA